MFDLDVVVAADGRVRGTGTASHHDQQVIVKVVGSNKPNLCTLTVTGEKRFRWTGKGPPTETGFTARWKARGFGAAVQGTGLPIAPQ